jgi:hypothetical protein
MVTGSVANEEIPSPSRPRRRAPVRGGEDNPPTARTGETTREGEHCTADLPDGSCLTEEEGERGADRWARYVDCVQANDGDPNDECPTPGEQP